MYFLIQVEKLEQRKDFRLYNDILMLSGCSRGRQLSLSIVDAAGSSNCGYQCAEGSIPWAEETNLML